MKFSALFNATPAEFAENQLLGSSVEISEKGLGYIRLSDSAKAQCHYKLQSIAGTLFDPETEEIVAPHRLIPDDLNGQTTDVQSGLVLANGANAYYALDGFHLRLFNWRGEWCVATTNRPDASSRWGGKRSFEEMYFDVAPSVLGLDPRVCYYVLVVHKEHFSFTTAPTNRVIALYGLNLDTFSQEGVDLSSFIETIEDYRIPQGELEAYLQSIQSTPGHVEWNDHGIMLCNYKDIAGPSQFPPVKLLSTTAYYRSTVHNNAPSVRQLWVNLLTPEKVRNPSSFAVQPELFFLQNAYAKQRPSLKAEFEALKVAFRQLVSVTANEERHGVVALRLAKDASLAQSLGYCT